MIKSYNAVNKIKNMTTTQIYENLKMYWSARKRALKYSHTSTQASAMLLLLKIELKKRGCSEQAPQLTQKLRASLPHEVTK